MRIMEEDRSKAILDSIEKRAFFKKSAHDDVAAYVVKESQRQREAGQLAADVKDKIDLTKTQEPELRKGHKTFMGVAIGAFAVILIVAVFFCIKLAN